MPGLGALCHRQGVGVTDLTGYMLKVPCKNCPFSKADTRIVFSCRERAEEIEEAAYRHGFPCHLSAVNHELPNGEETGYVFGPNTQHCAGALMMFLADGYDCWPGIGNDEDLAEALRDHLDFSAPHFECSEDFFEANEARHAGK